jgi:hypothetical protein
MKGLAGGNSKPRIGIRIKWRKYNPEQGENFLDWCEKNFARCQPIEGTGSV